MAKHDDIIHFRKPGKALTVEEKWVVLHVLQQCKEVQKHPERLPHGDSYQQASYYTGVSKKVVVEIARYFKAHGTVPPSRKTRNTLNHHLALDASVIGSIRRHLLQCQRAGTPCQAPQIQRFLQEQFGQAVHLRTVQRHIARLGFECRQTADSSRTWCEQPVIRQQRRAYLQQLQELHQAGYQPVYVDELFWSSSTKDRLDAQASSRQAQAPAWGLLHALSRHGFLPGCEHFLGRKKRKGGLYDLCNFPEFYKWFTNSLCPNVPHKTCIILDRAPHHFLPEENVSPDRLSKSQIQSWLTAHNVHWEEHWLKSQLAQVMQSQLDAMLLLRRVAATHGHHMLLLPPAHPELNPLELVWMTIMTKCREMLDGAHAANDIRTFAHTALAEVTLEICQNCFYQVQYFEEDYRRLDLELDVLEDTGPLP